MVEAFWAAIDLLVKVAFTAFCIGVAWFLGQQAASSENMELARMGIYGMLLVFVTLVWTYEKWH
jgi:hypothetical protein